MQRYMNTISKIILEIGEDMPFIADSLEKGESTDTDITVLLELYKLRNSILTEAIHFIEKYATQRDSENTKLLEGFKECKVQGIEIVREIEKSRLDRGLDI